MHTQERRRRTESRASATARLQIGIILAAVLITTSAARAGLIEFTSFDDWQASAGEFTTIGFTGFDEGTIVTDQYLDFGITFLDGDDFVELGGGFPQDLAGLTGGEAIRVEFDAPITSIAVHHPGSMRFELFNEGLSVGVANFFTGGLDNFAGVISSIAFDEVLMSETAEPNEFVFLDNLYFGPPIPAPATAIVGVVALVLAGRRRRDHRA